MARARPSPRTDPYHFVPLTPPGPEGILGDFQNSQRTIHKGVPALSPDPSPHPRESSVSFRAVAVESLLAEPEGVHPILPDEPRPATGGLRPRAAGKFLFVGDRKLTLRGVTYGTFAPGEAGDGYPGVDLLDRDFAAMAAAGVNAVRTYTPPPTRLLDAALRHGLWVQAGLPWAQHVAFLDDRAARRDAVRAVREGVAAHAGHPAILGYAVGNEIPAPIVRWHGAAAVERFLGRLVAEVRDVDPDALVTYVNYPTTEYLHLPTLDYVAFNVYLERQAVFRGYLARLHHVAGDRPLVMAEIGLDSRGAGERAQARSLEWQVRTTFAAGCAGAFVFAWTDEWHRGGHEVLDWDFGIVDRDRRPKPALEAVSQAFAESPFPPGTDWPRVSVVVCSMNGSRTIDDCFSGLERIDYPDFEVIVVDDGSTDDTGKKAGAFAAASDLRVTVHRTANRGLSAARNLGLASATGEIVAYLDDDARPDPDWLTHLAAAFTSTAHAGIGGPNVTPHEDGRVAACVANAPGGPIHVMVTDLEAEHIPGCNMAFRREALLGIGGFDPRFRAAGDDVDVCWRLQDAGHTLGFAPAAMVWHHRRGSVRAYWRQQVGYGKAEALLESKWPERYNRTGHLSWAGRLYNNGHRPAWRRGRVYQGVWGTAPFQSIYQPAPGFAWSLPAMPEWWLGVACLAIATIAGIAAWPPALAVTAPLLAIGLGLPLAQAALGGVRASFPGRRPGRLGAFLLRALTAGLHALQPLARLKGRVVHGLVPWRRRGALRFALPVPRTWTVWSETWREPAAWVRSIEAAARGAGAIVVRGGDWDRWDLETRCGTLASARLRTAVEEHGNGRQLLRVRAWPRVGPLAVAAVALFTALAVLAASEGALVASGILLGAATIALVGTLRDAGTALAAVDAAVRSDLHGKP